MFPLTILTNVLVTTSGRITPLPFPLLISTTSHHRCHLNDLNILTTFTASCASLRAARTQLRTSACQPTMHNATATPSHRYAAQAIFQSASLTSHTVLAATRLLLVGAVLSLPVTRTCQHRKLPVSLPRRLYDSQRSSWEYIEWDHPKAYFSSAVGRLKDCQLSLFGMPMSF
jgi:hypothetical protein